MTFHHLSTNRMSDIEDPNPLVVDELLAPVLPLIVEEARKMPRDAGTYTLSFEPFTLNLLVGLICGIKSIGLLVTHIQTSAVASTLGLVQASKSMYSEAFLRYNASIYRAIFYALLEKLHFLEIPEIRALGRFCCVDGSFFPALLTMTWALYQEKKKAIKLHLAFELNRMIPVLFLLTEANASERQMLLHMVEAGVTYIADRGYVCFDLFHQICTRQAHFIIRGTSNLLMDVYETLPVEMPATWSQFFTDVTDGKIRFTNDPNSHDYRRVSFMAMGEFFSLITDRFDLQTSDVIMLYAYRWQVELIFRFLKRTMHSLHLMCHHPSGLEIQFTLYMIAYLLLLHFKQTCAPVAEEVEINIDEINRIDMSQDGNPDEVESDSSKPAVQPSMFYVCGLVSLLGNRVRQYWKMGIHWLTTVRNLLLEPCTPDTKRLIWSKQ
jgi:hypothetical protein